MPSDKECFGLLASYMVVSAMCGGPYSDIEFHLPKSKDRPGTLVRCHVCGAGSGRITLYNDGDGKICAECRKKVG